VVALPILGVAVTVGSRRCLLQHTLEDHDRVLVLLEDRM
jgi:hypothetical protein